MKKNIYVPVYLILFILSFSLGFFIKKIADDKKIELLYREQANIQTINKNLIKENEFLKELNDKILNQDNFIDNGEKECLSKSVSVADSLSCIHNTEKKRDGEITRYLKLLKEAMPPEEYILIENNHKMWLAQNKKDNEITDKFIFNHGGTMYQQAGSDKKAELKKQRSEFLKDIYNVYTDNITDIR